MNFGKIAENLHEYFILFLRSDLNRPEQIITLENWCYYLQSDEPHDFMMVSGEHAGTTWWLRIYENGECHIEGKAGWYKIGTLHEIKAKAALGSA